MPGIGYSPIGIPNDMMETIKKIIAEVKLYRNPSEFVLAATRSIK